MERPGRREQNKIQCRKRILKGARRLFTEKGYESTTVEDLAAEAEISKATLYNYFDSKEDLLLGIAEAALAEIRQLVDEELRDEPSALVKLRRVITNLALDSIRYIALTRRILYLNAAPGSPLHSSREELLDIFRALVVEGQEKGELNRDLSQDMLTEAFYGVFLMTQFAWEQITAYSEEACIQKVDEAFALALRGLAPEGGAHYAGG